MNTWLVWRFPVGNSVFDFGNWNQDTTEPKQEQAQKQIRSVHDTAELVGEKTFFMKARIFAGQADVNNANGQYEDFKWLAKEEIENKVHPKYWSRVKDMLVEQ